MPDLEDSNFFIEKNGHHLHTCSEAHYPLAYLKSLFDWDVMDNELLRNSIESCSFVPFAEHNYPRKCLDLGCGVGAWTLTAAQEWPSCHFVGFDLVPIQTGLDATSEGVSDSTGSSNGIDRIQWMNGNFLKPLPFANEEFDHVYMRFIGRGVPETKWHHLIMEAFRVLRGGGALEIVEEDIIFPSLPKSCTISQFLKKTREQQNADDRDNIVRLTQQEAHHDHYLLESLFQSVMRARSINLTPTSYLPAIVDIFFKGVTTLPPLQFPLPSPPVSELLALSPSAPKLTASVPESATAQTRFSSYSHVSNINAEYSTNPISADGQMRQDHSDLQCGPYYSLEHTTSSVRRGIRMPRMALLGKALATHLLRSLDFVLACREAMWEVAESRIQAGETSLFDAEFHEDVGPRSVRERFEHIVKCYEEDVTNRAYQAFSQEAAVRLNWSKCDPPLTAEQFRDREDVRKLRAEALRLERAGLINLVEVTDTCRTIRPIVGWKH